MKEKEKNVSPDFVRGGQVAFHNLTMAFQVFQKSLSISLAIGLIAFFGYYTVMYLQNPATYDNAIMYLTYSFHGSYIPFPSWMAFKTVTDIHFWKILPFSLKVFSFSLILLLIFWSVYAKIKFKIRKHSGLNILTIKEANKILAEDSKNYSSNDNKENISFGKLNIPSNIFTTHLMITGATGTGKTNCLNTLLTQIRKAGDKAIILDSNNSFVQNFFNASKDFILNPLDERSIGWDFWSEGNDTSIYKLISASLIPDHKYSDPFWANAAQTILTALIEKEESTSDNGMQKIKKILTTYTDSMLKKHLKGTRGYQILASSDKTGGSIITTLAGWVTDTLYLLKDSDSDFSIKNFIESDKEGFLFMSSDTKDRDVLKNLMSAWLSISIKQSLIQRNNKKKLWIIIDELASLKKLPALSMMMAEGRKYNNCVVTAFQNVHQLFEIYGKDEGLNLMANSRTKFIFANSCHETNLFGSKELGGININKMSESVSFGASSIRDGVNIQFQEKREVLIQPEEIEQLKNLECFVKLPKGNGITKINMDYLDLSKINNSDK